jgi:dTDP-4-amino-4,6-dideoxygalactose transaminase
MQKVPFLDLTSQNDPIRTEIFEAIQDTIDASDFVLGPRLQLFEAAFAEYCDCRYALGLHSGTEALFLALRALDIGPDDEVITPPNVFIAAVEAIVRTGARAVLADVNEYDFGLDPEAVAKVITKRTKAIIPVHLFGQLCDMDPILELASSHNIAVIEDACQAHGAEYKGRKVGSLGTVAAFSFYPTKNLGAFGDGGAITTNDAGIADKIKHLRHHAQSKKNTHDAVGYNSRLDSIQAAVLDVKLRHLDRWNERRRELADRVRSKVSGGEYMFQTILPDTLPAYHILAVRHPRRQLVHDQLDQSGIGWGKHIAMPIHFQPGYRILGYEPGAFPVSEMLCNELVSLPIYPTLTTAQADYVAQALNKVVVSV